MAGRINVPPGTTPRVLPPAPDHILPHLAALADLAEAAAASTAAYLVYVPKPGMRALFGVGGKKPQFLVEIELLVSKIGAVGVESTTHGELFWRGVVGDRLAASGKTLRSSLLLLGNALSSLYQDKGKRGQNIRGAVEAAAKQLQHTILELAIELSSHGDGLEEYNDVFDIIQRCRAGLENPIV